jgi:hypothetical protein
MVGGKEMTLEEFLGQHREIAKTSPDDQVIAIAWFFAAHESKPRFTLDEIMDRFAAVGINTWDIPTAINRLSFRENGKLLPHDVGLKSSYCLARHVKDELDKQYMI